MMDEAVVHQTEHMTTIEASAVSQQVQQVHFAFSFPARPSGTKQTHKCRPESRSHTLTLASFPSRCTWPPSPKPR